MLRAASSDLDLVMQAHAQEGLRTRPPASGLGAGWGGARLGNTQSNELPGDADAAGPGVALCNQIRMLNVDAPCKYGEHVSERQLRRGTQNKALLIPTLREEATAQLQP